MATHADLPPSRRRVLAALSAAAGCGVLCSCGGGYVVVVWGNVPVVSASQPSPAQPAPRPLATTYARDLVHPWSLAFLPDGTALATERPGRMRLVGMDGQLSAPVSGLPAVDARGEGGLLDVALDPNFSLNRLVYWSYAEAGTGLDAGRNGTAVARGVLSPDGSALSEVQVLFRQVPKVDSTAHFGSRLTFAPDGTLFVTLGERLSRREDAQNLANHLGKVVRIRSDGSVPPDNPFVGQAGAAAEIWSLGHCNVQGAAVHPASGELWTSEHGPQGGDEVNITRAGRNFGWPRISYGCEEGAPVGACIPVGEQTAAPGLEQPLTYWAPASIAPSGMAFYTGALFPQWRGNLFIGALAGRALWRLSLDGDGLVAREALFAELGERIRDVRQGPDGALYLLTDDEAGRIVRIHT